MNRAFSEHQEKKTKGLLDKNFFYCLFLCFFIAFLSIIYFIVAGNGAFTLRDDFNTQILAFSNQINGFIKQAVRGEWCWYLDIGASFVNGFSYYGLGSPFFWITLLFPRTMVPYLVGWLYMLKYAVAGGTAYLFFKCHTGKGGWQEIFGAVLYAFSGFSAAALEFYFFHDVIALFPLMLIGIEKLVKDKNTVFFTAAVFINCLLNYYFFIGEVFFCVLYFLFLHSSAKKSFLQDAGKCLLCGIVGVGMAGVLFVPSILYILSNPRTSTHLSWRSDLLPSLRNCLYFAKGILLPGEAMNNQSAIYNAEWNSTACWLPMSGISLCIAYILKKRDRLSHLLLLLTAISFSPFLSSGFSMFTRNYQRWWFMFALIGALASVHVLNSIKDYPIKAGIFINMAIVALYFAGVYFLHKKGIGGKLIYHPRRFLFFVLISLAGLAYLYFAAEKIQRYRAQLLVLGVSAIACATTLITIYIYRIDSESTESILNKYALAGELNVIDEQYRYELENNKNLVTLPGDIAGVGAFTSTCSNYRFEFNDLFDYDSSIFSLRKDEYPGLSALFGAKFVVAEKVREGKEIYDHLHIGGNEYYVTDQLACPLGYAVDSYILKSDLMQLDLMDRGIALLQAVVIDEKDEPLVKDILKKADPEKLDLSEKTSKLIRRNQERKVDEFHRDSRGFSCTTNYDSDSMFYFSVPNDPGWIAQIDGNRTNTINSGGLILLSVPAGSHMISFVYRTPGLRIGLLISILAIIVFIIHCVVVKRRK